MTPVIRSQGRPVRGVGEFGRIRLLERTRDAMKSKPRIDIQRREIAAFAGITPALVSYYFPDKWSLLEAAAKPIIEAYVKNIRSVISSTDLVQDKLRNLAYVMIEFNFNEGYLLDFYVDYSRREEPGKILESFEKVLTEIGCFMDELARCGLLRCNDVSFLQSAFWNLCKTVGQDLREKRFEGQNMPDIFWARAELTCDMLLNHHPTPSLSRDSDALRYPAFDSRRGAPRPLRAAERSDAMEMRLV